MWTDEKAHAIAIIEVLRDSIDLQEALLVAVEDLVHYEVTLKEIRDALDFIDKQLHPN